MSKAATTAAGMRTALTIAGSDSSCGAGAQLDLKVFHDLGVYGLCAVTAVTAQNTKGVQKICKVPPRVVAAQIDSVTRDIGVDACKIGMLYSPSAITAVADRIKRRGIPNVVLDTILASKDGTPFLTGSGIRRLRKLLIPVSAVVTPNVPEAEILSGIRIKSIEDMRNAALRIHDMGCRYVLIKGGHLEGSPVDLLYDGDGFLEIPGTRVDGTPVHGTGCALSAAIAAQLALGESVPDAVAFAKQYVAGLIESAVQLGKGNRLIHL